MINLEFLSHSGQTLLNTSKIEPSAPIPMVGDVATINLEGEERRVIEVTVKKRMFLYDHEDNLYCVQLLCHVPESANLVFVERRDR